jgi:hypothetical protein
MVRPTLLVVDGSTIPVTINASLATLLRIGHVGTSTQWSYVNLWFIAAALALLLCLCIIGCCVKHVKKYNQHRNSIEPLVNNDQLIAAVTSSTRSSQDNNEGASSSTRRLVAQLGAAAAAAHAANKQMEVDSSVEQDRHLDNTDLIQPTVTVVQEKKLVRVVMLPYTPLAVPASHEKWSTGGEQYRRTAAPLYGAYGRHRIAADRSATIQSRRVRARTRQCVRDKYG